MKILNSVALTLVIIGSLNWLLVGLFKFDIVGALFGGMSSIISRIVFVLVGIAGLWACTFFKKITD